MTLLTKLQKSRKIHPDNKIQRKRLSIERVEDRRLMAADVLLGLNSTGLVIEGTDYDWMLSATQREMPELRSVTSTGSFETGSTTCRSDPADGHYRTGRPRERGRLHSASKGIAKYCCQVACDGLRFPASSSRPQSRHALNASGTESLIFSHIAS